MDDGKRSCDVLIKKRASRPGFKTIASQTPDSFLVELFLRQTAVYTTQLNQKTLQLSKLRRPRALNLIKMEALLADDEATQAT